MFWFKSDVVGTRAIKGITLLLRSSSCGENMGHKEACNVSEKCECMKSLWHSR